MPSIVGNFTQYLRNGVLCKLNAKILTVWGRNGSGKTTFAVNLALSLAARNYMIGIISSKIYYGEMQSMFGQRVEVDQGIYKSLSNGSDTKNMFTSVNVKNNVFFLSVPNDIDAMLMTAISMESIKEMIEDTVMRFDYLIIDGNEELNNAVSSVGLVEAQQIFIIHHPSVPDCLWYKGMGNMMDMLHLKNKAVHILNAYDKSCDKIAYSNSMNVKFEFELDLVDKAKIYENSGTPIYTQKNFQTKRYRSTIDKIASLAALN